MCVLLASAPAAAQSLRDFSIPAGSLADAIAALARQGDVDVGAIDLAVAARRVGALRGRFTPGGALDRLLAGSGLRAIPVAAGAFRIVAAAASPRAPVVRRPPVAPPIAPPTGPAEIIVTAGKRAVPLSRYAGSALVVALDGSDGAGPRGLEGSSYLVRQTPILQSTELGSGRNKLFIRGIADSSFTGPTQATAATYFGDVRMGYNGPDPSLALYDMARAEVLEGPQGTLYGAGSIGGVIRLTPHAPDLRRLSASVDGGLTVTQGGALGDDIAATLNVPIGQAIALRAVGYRSVDGGFVDDTARALSHVNRTRTAGGRGALRVVPLEGWTIDLGVVTQSISAPDLQYATTGMARIARASATAQPFEDDYLLARAVVTKDWESGVTLTGSYGHVWHDTNQRYDATRNVPGANVLAYDEDGEIRMTSSEVRLSRTVADGAGWVVGASMIDDTTAKSRRFGRLSAPRDIVGVTNRTREKAAFGELTLPVGGSLAVTAGARLTHARMDGEPNVRITQGNLIRGQASFRLDPTGGLTWQFAPRLSAFARYSQGFRTAGLAVAQGIGRVANYRSDTIRVGEAGVRLARAGQTGLSGSAAFSYARWADIQADLVDRIGFPYTSNVGDGRIGAIEALGNWRMAGGWHIDGGVLLTRSKLVDPLPDFAGAANRTLPDTPRITVTLAGGWRGTVAGGHPLTLDASARYAGHSTLGLGPALDIKQGNYVETRLAGRLALGRFGVSLEAGNLLNDRSNRFAIGNPFGVVAGNQYTPQRPRNVRLGVSAGF